MKTTLVTGANGFVGKALRSRLLADGAKVTAVCRTVASGCVAIGTIDAQTDWSVLLQDVDSIVHLAARVHVMKDSASDPMAVFRSVNVDATLNLARQAARKGVRRFVFVSSIKVNGEESRVGAPFTAGDLPAPIDPYGISKREAEDALLDLGRVTGMEIVILRPPLVYGPGVGANFEAMMRWLKRGVPLPFGAIRNRRTLVGIDNLVDLIVTSIDHPAAAGEIFLAGDDEDLSTSDLLRRLGAALGVPVRLIPVPSWAIEKAAALLGKRALAQRLCGNLQVDISKARRLLGWKPPLSVDEGLSLTAAHFLGRGGA